MTNKTIIERGASWTLEETKLLLLLWGQDLVSRKETNAKRTKEVYEKISENFGQKGFERTADQVRTRVFNMIAEYRRILRDNNNAERKKKCIFYDSLDKIYQAKHMDDLKSALDDFEPAEFPFSPQVSERGEGEVTSDGEATDCNESFSNNNNNSSSNNNNRTSKNPSSTTTPVNSSATSTSKGSKYPEGRDEIDEDYITNINTTTGETENATTIRNKRMKLEQSPNSVAQNLPTPNQKTSASNASTSASNNSSTPADQQNQSSSTTNSTNVKQNQTSSSNSATTTVSGGSSTSQAPTATPSTSSTPHRTQSLLLPHASTSASSASNPINKITITGGGPNNAPTFVNINNHKLPILRTDQLVGTQPNRNDSSNLNGTAARLPTTAAITSHQLYQAPVNTFDVTSSALLIDRMFAHLSRESENMREWIALEKERLALEKTRRQQDAEQNSRRERLIVDTLTRFQEVWLSFISRLDPRISENIKEPIPQLKIPTVEGSQQNLQAGNAHSSADNVSQTATTQNNTSTSNNSASSKEGNKS